MTTAHASRTLCLALCAGIVAFAAPAQAARTCHSLPEGAEPRSITFSIDGGRGHFTSQSYGETYTAEIRCASIISPDPNRYTVELCSGMIVQSSSTQSFHLKIDTEDGSQAAALHAFISSVTVFDKDALLFADRVSAGEERYEIACKTNH